MDYDFAGNILLTYLSAEMEKFGIKIIRFKNNGVERRIEKVVTEIKSAVKKRLESPPWGI